MRRTFTAEEKTFLIKIITPERVFYEGTAIMAEFNQPGVFELLP